jgi:hypothetical protein
MARRTGVFTLVGVMRTPDRSALLRDAGLALGLAMVSLFFAYPAPGAMAVVLGMCAPLVVRRAYPRVALAALTVAAMVQVVTQESPTVSVVAVPILVHSLARWSTTANARAGLAVALAGAVVGPARWLTNRPDEPTAEAWATAVTGIAATVVAVFIAGRRGRDREERETQRARERAERRRLELAET